GGRRAHEGHLETIELALERVGLLFPADAVQIETDAGTPMSAEVFITGSLPRDAIRTIAIGISRLIRGDTVAVRVPIALNAKSVQIRADSPLWIDEGARRAAAGRAGGVRA